VRDLVKQHGPKKWAVIAERLSGKTQKQVYARWRDYLQPGLTTRAWEPFEEEHLIQIQEVIGNQWAVLARLMPGRSPNAIKNKFHATRRKFERKGDHFDDDGDE
jgi:Myb superfamily proteins, including transcription factors and mRNA splicing factors